MMKKSFKAGAEKMEAYLQANPDANTAPALIDSIPLTSAKDSAIVIKK